MTSTCYCDLCGKLLEDKDNKGNRITFNEIIIGVLDICPNCFKNPEHVATKAFQRAAIAAIERNIEEN